MECQSAEPRKEQIGNEKQCIISFSSFLRDPDDAADAAKLQKFAVINPYYPGVRAAVAPEVVEDWCRVLGPMLSAEFETHATQWSGAAWFSLVTTPPDRLAPIQRLPHVDGTDSAQIAMMLYLHTTSHGGTAFFRHCQTGFETLTAERYPIYKASIEEEVAKMGMPGPAYPTTGAPFFERSFVAGAAYNSAIFYRGNLFHSGVIDNDAALVADPVVGRLTVNAFFRPRTRSSRTST